MKYFKIILVLLVVSLISAFCLSLVSSWAQAKIAQNQIKAVEKAIYNIAPQTKKVEKEKVGKNIVYKLYGNGAEFLGYAFLAQGYGYQGKIKIMCGVDKNFQKMLGIEIIESSETPGLGAHINDTWFKKQFRGISVLPEIIYSKRKPTHPNEIQAISGATISSRSVVKILNKEIAQLQKELKR